MMNKQQPKSAPVSSSGVAAEVEPSPTQVSTTVSTSATAPSANEADWVYTIDVPTFRPDQGTQTIEVDIMSLIASETNANALEIADPFLYHSIFTPGGHHLTREAWNVANAQSSGNESLSTTVTVVRRRCVAAECDAVTIGLWGSRMPVRNDEDQVMIDEDNEGDDGGEDIDVDIDQLFVDDGLARQ